MDEFSLDDNKKIDDFFAALDDVGLTEDEWDNFGVLWRKFGAKCPGQSEDFPNLTILNKAKKGREKRTGTFSDNNKVKFTMTINFLNIIKF